MSFDVLLSAGSPRSSTVGAPGVQGAGVTGVQGTGVGTPALAAVAAIKAGLAGALHMPKGGMLDDLLSMMLPASLLLVVTVFGVATNVLGAAPKVHCIFPPVQV